MFGFLKDKVKSAISSITDRFDKEAEIVETKEEERIEITETEFICYSNSTVVLQDFQVLKDLSDLYENSA